MHFKSAQMEIARSLDILLFIFLSSLSSAFADDVDKRILVNDPSFLEQRLSHMESLIQQLQTDLNGKTSEITKLQTDLNVKTTEITKLQTDLNGKTTEITTLHANLNENITQLKGTIQQFSSQLQTLTNQDGGAIFTRWGRKDCPNNTETVYSGFAAGGYFDHTGAATDYLCMPRDPTLGAASPSWNYVYGVEYESNYWKADSHDEDAPCAVCRSPIHTTTMMLPGRNRCYTGWTLQYNGNLGTGASNQKSSHSYACVDQDPHYLSGGEGRNTDGSLFYPVSAQCGTLQCPPYKQGRWVTCAVCTR